MTSITLLIAVLLFASVMKSRNALRHTSIHSAGVWAIAAAGVVVLAAIAPFFQQLSVQHQSLLQYSAAVMSLTPFIDVLGARRPAHASWPWFVILPLVLVLHWPAISQLAAENAVTPIEIPTPTFVGFLFVVLMGCGNYFGTDNMPSAFLAGLGIVFTAIPVSEWGAFTSPWMFSGGAFLLLAAVTLAVGGRREESTDSRDLTAHDALWTDFCSLYGMVWAKRVMDRVNQFAARESWTVRMSVYGFVSQSDIASQQAHPTSMKVVDDRPLQVLCWVLRRFLDQAFLLRYLPTSAIGDDLENPNADKNTA